MLIPRFSLRWLLGLTTVSAVVSLVVSFAVRGEAWALGLTAGLWSVAIAFVLYVTAFLAAWLMANTKLAFSTVARRQMAIGESPFGDQTPGPPTSDSPPAMTS